MIASRRSLRAPAIVLALLAGASLATAQESRGTILGRVTDPDGGALPGVSVAVTNESTGVSSRTVTQPDGAYAVRFLVPGVYRVEVEMPGFSKYAQSGITLAIVMLVPRDGNEWMIAMHRFFEVSIGIVVGLGLSAAWPERTSGAAEKTGDSTSDLGAAEGT